jgi:hypothetical protein
VVTFQQAPNGSNAGLLDWKLGTDDYVTGLGIVDSAMAVQGVYYIFSNVRQ